MPKGKKKIKGPNALLALKKNDMNGSIIGSDDESNIDNVSIISYTSSMQGYGSDHTVNNNNDEEENYYDDFQDKILEAMDGTSDKSAKARDRYLKAIEQAFTTRYMFDFIMDRKMTVMDVLEKCLKRGKAEDQGSAAIVTAISFITIGSSPIVDELFASIQPLLLVYLNDNSLSLSVRSKLATTLGICSFIADTDIPITTILENLYCNFSGSFLKGNGAIPILSIDLTNLHASALLSWTLLLTVQSPQYVYSVGQDNINKIIQLLDSSNLELRIAAGEAIAVIYEICREFNDDFNEENYYSLCDKLRLLATDTQKFRAKKDKKIQRSLFRDILKAVEEGESPNEHIKFGREKLIINTWRKRRQYNALCQVLGSGMNLHLAQNDLLRDIFDLGPVLSIDCPFNKVSKFERHMGNIAIAKARTKTRGKLRDKRSDMV